MENYFFLVLASKKIDFSSTKPLKSTLIELSAANRVPNVLELLFLQHELHLFFHVMTAIQPIVHVVPLIFPEYSVVVRKQRPCIKMKGSNINEMSEIKRNCVESIG